MGVTGSGAPTLKALSEWESKSLLALPGPDEIRSRDVEEAIAFAQIYGQVVAKISGHAHKTEVGGVRLGLDADGVARVWAELAALGDGTVLIAEQCRGDFELILGTVRDPQFGDTATIGLGGEQAELLNDVVAVLLPLVDGELESALAQLRMAPLFHGYRGRAAVDLAALERVLKRLAEVLATHPDIEEIDCNPILIRGGSPLVLDALVVVRDGG